MNSNTLEFFVKMKDLMSGGLTKLAQNAQQAFKKVEDAEHNAFNRMKQSASGYFSHVKGELERLKNGLGNFLGKAGGILGLIGISTGAFAAGEFGKSSIEAAHQLHMAEAQLINTMQNKGYSHFAITNAVEDAKKLSQNVLFSKEQVIGLESQLRLVGNISESEMQRMAKASEDMATKFHEGLDEAGNAIAKAVNNPEMLRRLAMQLKIDPAMQEHLQNLAKHGKEAQARLELLAIVEKQVGGSAEAAFNTDPIAKYNKTLEDLKITTGNTLLPMVTSLADIANGTLKLINVSESVPGQLRTEKGAVDTLVGAITSLNEGNTTRKALLSQLVQQYPEFFKGIDTEKIKNSELLTMLNSVNDAYNKRIGLAQAAYNAEVAGNDVNDIKNILNKANLQLAYYKAHPGEQRTITGLKYLNGFDALKLGIGKLGYGKHYDINSIQGLQQIVADFSGKLAGASGAKTNADLNNTFSQAVALMQDPNALKQQFGGDKNALQNFLSLAHQIQHYGGRFHTPGGVGFASQLQNAMNAGKSTADILGGVNGGSNTGGGYSSTTDIGRAAASGGPRVININGVKFADKIEIHGESMQDAYSKTETKMQEMYLRILNSGASVQNN